MNEILVDTSVWIDYFNNYDSPYTNVLDDILDSGLIVTCNLIKAEILPFLPDRSTFEELRSYFNAFPQREDYDGMWHDIIEYQYNLVQNNIRGIGIPDIFICSLAIKYDDYVFAKDKHFARISDRIPLKLFEF